MTYLQVNEKGENTIIKDFLDELEELGVECKLDIKTKKENEVCFTVIVRNYDEDIKTFKRSINRHLIRGKV